MHARLDEQLSTKYCVEEIESIKAHGQRVPLLGRPVRDDRNVEVEVICGARRLFAAQQLGIDVLVDVRDLDDREAIIATHIDGLRKDLSPYERGLAYKHWLGAGHFSSQEEMASVLNVSQAGISRAIQLANLPSVVVSALGDVASIPESWGAKLTEVLRQRRDPVIRAARAIAGNRGGMRPQQVYTRLLAAAAPTAPGTRKAESGARDEVVCTADGSPLYRIAYRRAETALVLPANITSQSTLAAIQDAVTKILTAATTNRLTAPQRPERGIQNEYA